jgi:SEC-C motif
MMFLRVCFYGEEKIKLLFVLKTRFNGYNMIVAYLLLNIRRKEMKVGRNDPCLCGSGKKYKKCCMAKDVVVGIRKVREERFFRLKYELSEEIYQFLERSLPFSEKLRAEAVFGQKINSTQNSDMLGPLFRLWYLFFHRFDNGLRGVEWFYQEKKTSLKTEKARLLETWVSLVPRLIQFVDMDESGVTAEDAFTHERFHMPFCETMSELVPWGGTFCLLEPFDEGYYVHGVAIIEGPRGIKRAYAKINELMSETRRSYEQIAMTYFLEIVNELMDPYDIRHREMTKIDEVTLHYEVDDGKKLVHSLEKQDVVIVDEQKGKITKLSFAGRQHIYEDNLASSPVYMREVLGFIEINKNYLKFVTLLPDAVESFMKVMEKAGSLARFIKKTVRKLDAPKNVEFRSYAMQLGENVPLYFGALANQTLDIYQSLHAPQEEWDGKTVMQMAKQGKKEEVERWLQEREYISFMNAKQLECPVTVDFNTIRRKFGLPLSLFVTLGEKRQTRLLEKQRTHEMEQYEQYDLPLEWMDSFFGTDIAEFFIEKTRGKSEATVSKYRTGLSIIAQYLLQSRLSAWTSITKDHWQQCIVYHYLETNGDASINQAKSFFSVIKALAKWVDARYGTNHDKTVRSIIQTVEEEIYNAIRLLDLYVPYTARKYHYWLQEIERDVVENALANHQVSGLFQIIDVSAAMMRCKHAESGKQYTISITPFVRSYAKAGMIIRGNIVKTPSSGRWKFIHVSRVFPKEAGQYLSGKWRLLQD